MCHPFFFFFKDIEVKFAAVCVLATQRRAALNQVKELHEVSTIANELEAWILEKMTQAAATTASKDLNHSLALLNKFQDFQKDLLANEAQIHHANELADTMVARGMLGSEELRNTMSALNKKWSELKRHADTRNVFLQNQQQLLSFGKDVSETDVLIKEKISKISDDLGKDVGSVETLLRTHDALALSFSAIAPVVEGCTREMVRLLGILPQCKTQLEDIIGPLNANWGSLRDRAGVRRTVLLHSQSMHKFIQDAKDMQFWMQGIRAVLALNDWPDTVTQADTLVTVNANAQVEIMARQADITELVAMSVRAVKVNPHAKEIIEQKSKLLESEYAALLSAWKTRNGILEEKKNRLIFNRDVKQMESWVDAQQAVLSSLALTSDSVSAVESTIKTHVSLENGITAQEEQIKALAAFVDKLATEKHTEITAIKQGLEVLRAHRATLVRTCASHKIQLHLSLDLQKFLRDTTIVDIWVQQQLQTVSDESYRDGSHTQVPFLLFSFLGWCYSIETFVVLFIIYSEVFSCFTLE